MIKVVAPRKIELPDSLQKIIKTLEKSGAKAIVVGGAVRDFLLNKDVKDFDIEVYNIDNLKSLESLLKPFGSVNQVGKSFGVLKLKVDNIEYDFSLPRLETKINKGHKGFSVKVESKLNFTQAFKRRDFTINAIGYDVENRKFIDPYSGLNDLINKTLRHINSITFIEDPLRVYRAVQFSARFEFSLNDKTKELCKSMVEQGVLDELPKERIWQEWSKLLLKANKPSIGFELMRELGIIKRYYPELNALINTPQEPKWHPEGDVWVHTLMALDKMAMLCNKKQIEGKERLKFMYAILCHDLGKPATTQIREDGYISSIGHEKAGVEPTINFLKRLSDEQKFIEKIIPLVKEHLQPSIYYKNRAKDSTIKHLAARVNIKDLVLVARADFLGRTTKESLNGEYKAGDWLLERAKELNVDKEPIKPFITGKDLISLGLKPTPKFKEILDFLYKIQLTHNFKTKDEAIANLHKIYDKIM